MQKIFTRLHAWLAARVTSSIPDPIGRMTARELADLPPYHPRTDAACPC